MSITEIKTNLKQEIDQINDEELLNELSEIIHRTQSKTTDAEWNSLPAELKQAIEEGISQSEKGQVLSHNEFRLRVGKWHTK